MSDFVIENTVAQWSKNILLDSLVIKLCSVCKAYPVCHAYGGWMWPKIPLQLSNIQTCVIAQQPGKWDLYRVKLTPLDSLQHELSCQDQVVENTPLTTLFVSFIKPESSLSFQALRLGTSFQAPTSSLLHWLIAKCHNFIFLLWTSFGCIFSFLKPSCSRPLGYQPWEARLTSTFSSKLHTEMWFLALSS